MLSDDHAHFYELVAVREQLLMESMRDVSSDPVTKQQLEKLNQGAGATVAEWPTIGIMIQDPVSKRKADDLLASIQC